MRIGVDGLPLTQVLTGVGHYTNELAHHLAEDSPADLIAVISPKSFLASPITAESNHRNLVFTRSPGSLWNKQWWSIGLPRLIRKKPLDVFHGTNFEVPLQKVCPTVVTIHDLCMILHPNTQKKKLARRAQLRLPLMARTATMIITPTAAVRQELQDHLGIDPDTIVAVPEAPRACFRPMGDAETLPVRRQLNLTGDFLLFVGTIEPRKNLQTLVKAFEQAQAIHRPPLQLVLAGRKGWLVDDLLDRIRRSPIADKIVLAGYLKDEELCALYSSCAAFVYPSLYEGFGLPPLEAMACGAPVVVSRIPSLIEVTGSAAHTFRFDDADELSHLLVRLLDSESLRRESSASSLKRAAEFSWARTARMTRDVYRAAIQRYLRVFDHNF